MTTMEWIFGIASVAGLGIAALEHIRGRIAAANERTNIFTIREQYKALVGGSTAVLHTIDSIVQLPKKRAVGIDELQDIARLARSQLYLVLQQVDESQKALGEWRYGEVIASHGGAPKESDSALDAVREHVLGGRPRLTGRNRPAGEEKREQ